MHLPITHLGALTYSHNNTPYAIRAEVAFDFRSPPLLTSLRLTPLTLPASPDLAPSAIDLVLHGRWQTALAPLRKRVVLQIDNAAVRRSDDPDVNPVRLELDDPAPQGVAVHLLAGDNEPVSFVSADTLAVGLQSCTGADRQRFLNQTAPGATAAAPQMPRNATVSFGEPPRAYEYRPVAEVADPHGHVAPGDTKYNVFGVVIDCRAPCTTSKPALRSEIVIADESSAHGVSPGGKLKLLPIFTFENDPQSHIPFRAVGDIVRVHRITVSEYEDRFTQEKRRSGCARFYTTFVMWELDGSDFLPVTTRQPVRQDSAEHVITHFDRQRVRELRKWAKDYIFRVHRTYRPFLRTVVEIAAAHDTADFMSKSIDVLCYLERDAFVDDSTGQLKMIVSDGFRPVEQRERILVESESPTLPPRLQDQTFLQFCPSWRLRPASSGSWLVLRDVHVRKRGTNRVIVMSVGRKTTTLIWNSEGSPDFRKVKELMTGLALLPETAPAVSPASVAHAYGYGNGPPAMPRGIPPSLPPPAERNIPLRRRRLTHGSLNSHQDRLSEQPRRTPQKRPHPEGNVRGSLQDVRASSRGAERGGAGGMHGMHGPQGLAFPQARPFDETTAPRLPLMRRQTIISTHENKDIPVSTIGNMLKAVKEGRRIAYRLKVTARACSSPKDVRFACKPWCKSCSRYLKIDCNHGQLECLTCGDTFTSTRDPQTGWAYSVKLVLEDAYGGRIDGWIDGNEGTTFFSGLSPMNLLNDTEARQRVSKSLQGVLASKNLLDCLVKPYEYEDDKGFYRVACKIFGTKLVPERLTDDDD